MVMCTCTYETCCPFLSNYDNLPKWGAMVPIFYCNNKLLVAENITDFQTNYKKKYKINHSSIVSRTKKSGIWFWQPCNSVILTMAT